jgi:hypothetical protein
MKALIHAVPIALCVLTLLTVPASATAPAESCSDGPETGAIQLPFSQSSSPSSGDFSFSGSGCQGAAYDSVACFTPASSCAVDLSCSVAFASSTESTRGFATTINLFAGPCTDVPGPPSCIDSSLSASGSASLTNQALTGGQEYCVICAHSYAPGPQLNLSIALSAGSTSCGDLPVELMHFAVE